MKKLLNYEFLASIFLTKFHSPIVRKIISCHDSEKNDSTTKILFLQREFSRVAVTSEGYYSRRDSKQRVTVEFSIVRPYHEILFLGSPCLMYSFRKEFFSQTRYKEAKLCWARAS